MKPKEIRKKEIRRSGLYIKSNILAWDRSPKQKYGLHIKPNIYKRNGLDIKPIVSSYSMNRSKSPKKIKWSAFKAQYVSHCLLSTSAACLVAPSLRHQGTLLNPHVFTVSNCKKIICAKAYNMHLSQSLNCKGTTAATDSIKPLATERGMGDFISPIEEIPCAI